MEITLRLTREEVLAIHATLGLFGDHFLDTKGEVIALQNKIIDQMWEHDDNGIPV